MKTIRSWIIAVAGLLMLLALAATGAKAQALYSAHFVGTFNLPFTAQWGPVILPPGEYELNYGRVSNAGPKVAQIRGSGELPQAVILPMGRDEATGTESALICLREGDKGYVSGLELPEVGESIHFALPHGVSVESWITTAKLNHNLNTQLAEVRIPVKPAK